MSDQQLLVVCQRQRRQIKQLEGEVALLTQVNAELATERDAADAVLAAAMDELLGTEA